MADAARIRITRVIAPTELGEQIEPKMHNLGNAIGRRAQRVVPKRSWALHDSINESTERSGAVVTTTVSVGGPSAPYWEIVEKGLAGQPLQPYMRPALLQSRAGDLVNESPLGPKHGVMSGRPVRRSRPKR